MQLKTPGGVIDLPDAEPSRPHPDAMLGLATETLRLKPLNGHRHPATEGSCGWYIWGGEKISEAANFFSPIPVKNVSDYLASVVPFLNLPPGYRFLIDSTGHTDVWFDETLLNV